MLAVAVLMLVVGGAADMASAAFRMSMLQSAASDDVRGRLQGVFTVVVVGGPRIADVAHGAVAASIGAAATAAGGGRAGGRSARCWRRSPSPRSSATAWSPRAARLPASALRDGLGLETRCALIWAEVNGKLTHCFLPNISVWSFDHGEVGFSDWP